MVSFHSTVGHSYETIYILSRNMAIYQKGQLKSVQLMVQLQHFEDLNQQMKFFLLGVMVLFDYFNGRVSDIPHSQISRHLSCNEAFFFSLLWMIPLRCGLV